MVIRGDCQWLCSKLWESGIDGIQRHDTGECCELLWYLSLRITTWYEHIKPQDRYTLSWRREWKCRIEPVVLKGALGLDLAAFNDARLSSVPWPLLFNLCGIWQSLLHGSWHMTVTLSCTHVIRYHAEWTTQGLNSTWAAYMSPRVPVG